LSLEAARDGITRVAIDVTRPRSNGGLRLLVFDKTCVGRVLPGLSAAWQAGSVLYRALGRLDAAFGATNWDEALGWIAGYEPTRLIEEIQYWGHGKWGCVFIDRQGLDAGAFAPAHPLRERLDSIRERLLPNGESLVWLRTCEAFGAKAGQDFASRLADFMGSRVAGHTFIIDVLQSGLHGLRPGHTPDWSPEEGLLDGTAQAPKRARRSSPRAPRTVTCFDGVVPEDWFA
jgi:hypothetical protein